MDNAEVLRYGNQKQDTVDVTSVHDFPTLGAMAAKIPSSQASQHGKKKQNNIRSAKQQRPQTATQKVAAADTWGVGMFAEDQA